MKILILVALAINLVYAVDTIDYLLDTGMKAHDLGCCYDRQEIKTIKDQTRDGHSDCPCIESTTCTVDTTCPYGTITDAADGSQVCHAQSCKINPEDCALGFTEIDATNFKSYETCGNLDPEYGVGALKGQIVRVMLVPEAPNGFFASSSGACLTSPDMWPVGCDGFSYQVVDRMQAIAKFEVEMVTDLPDALWENIWDYCLLTEGPNWATDAEHESSSSLCELQFWTICVRAASLGYVDICPNLTLPTPERLQMTAGLQVFPRPNYFYSRVSVRQDFGLFVIFLVWDTSLWLFVACWIIVAAFIVRFTAGYYNPVNSAHFSLTFFLLQLSDLIWFGCGLFLDLIYPQHLPSMTSKITLLIFEFVQVMLLASITASLTNFLVMKEEVGLSSFTEIENIPGAKLCFEQKIEMDNFLIYYPNFPDTHTKFSPTTNWDDVENDPECYGLVTAVYDMDAKKSEGKFCDWEQRELVYSYNFYSPTNPAIHDALNAVFKIYQNTFYQRDIYNWIRMGVGEDQCEGKQEESGFDSLRVNSFAGLFIIFGFVACLGLIYYQFIAAPIQAFNYQMVHLAAVNESNVPWDNSIASKQVFCK